MKKQKVRRQLAHEKKSKSREYNYNADDDGISILPEEILTSIVSLLPLKDAAVTRTLSRRWRYLRTKNLNFDVGQQALNLSDCSKRKLKFKRRRYIKWVNTVINQYDTADDANIDHFRVSFDLHASHGHSISNWIRFAMQKRVQILELEFLVGGQCVRSNWPTFGNNDNYNLDRLLFFASKGGDEVGFKSLKVLNLVGVNVDGEVIEYLLSNCLLLERLQVTHSSKLANLRVVGSSRPSSLALKHLEIKLCSGIRTVEICDAENLVSLCCDRCELKPMGLVIRNVPMLVDLKIDFGVYDVHAIFTALSCCLSQLQTLELKLGFEEYVENPVYPMLTNLKELKLALYPHDGHILAQLIPFMEVSPFLQKLALKITEWDEDEEEQEFFIKPAKCSHHSLKELEVFGYGGRPNEDELIIYFIENAVSLQKIIVNPCLFMEFPHIRVSKHKKDMMEEEEEMARAHAMEHLKQKVPSTIDFICL
ncbi:hypothetical protein FNV43_RR05637 [Rhamnella rubrinervis]|uniref:F-box domain-containing protein n=1 Tax=Rhamnella rubrinervis TaxID=2594499 RepID=A0A8K0HPE6_9ROSA|nr:hypothetical protein FNV43_RR05637 [Rhamnella rubrinervis]